MRCRPKVCQCVAAQLATTTGTTNGAHVWISDDLLSDAFSRFVRVSRTSRRYGSNVPGPLEAHRRSSKRRMGIAAGAGVASSMFSDLGALFGLSSAIPPEDGWKWQAPSFGHGVFPGQPPPSSRTTPLPQTRKHKASGQRSNLLEIWPEFASPPNEPSIEELIQTSKIGLNALLRSRADLSAITQQDLDPVISFLLSSANERKAQNLQTVLTWLTSRELEPSALRSLSEMICDKVKLASIDPEEVETFLEALPTLTAWRTSPQSRLALVDALHEVWLSLRSQDASGYSVWTSTSLIDMVNRLLGKGYDALLFQIEMISEHMPEIARIDSDSAIQHLADFLMVFKVQATHFEVKQYELASHLATALQKMSAESLPSLIPRCTEQFFAHANHHHSQATALFWLQSLHLCKALEGPHIDNAAWSGVYAELAKHFSPSDLTKHFAEIDAEDCARLLILHWGPRLCVWNGSEHLELQKDILIVKDSAGPISDSQPWKSLSKDMIPLVMQDFDRERWLRKTKQIESSKYAVVDLARVLQRHGIWCEPLLREVCSMFEMSRPANVVHNIFSRLVDEAGSVCPSSIAAQTIRHFLQRGDHSRALAVFRLVPSLSLLQVPELPLTLIEHRDFDNTTLFDLILRQTPSDLVPKQDRLTPKLSLSQDHIDMIHLVAHKIAGSPRVPSRVAYRRVWACYRCLKDRGAPMTPLMSRAIVRTGIIRPFEERTGLPEAKTGWIIGTVLNIEGRQVAKELERLIFYLRRRTWDEVGIKKRLDLWKRTSQRCGGDVESLKTLRKCGPKIWAKRKTPGTLRYALSAPAGNDH